MSPGIEEAWIAVAGVGTGGVIGVAGSWLGALMNGRSAAKTTAATIEANTRDIKAQIDASEATTKAQIDASGATAKAQIESALATVSSQIEADRRHRMWEKRAVTYTDAIALIRHEQKIRGIQIVATRIGTEKKRPDPPVDLIAYEARMIAFSSAAVLEAQKAYFAAAEKFAIEYGIWNDDVRIRREHQDVVSSGVIPPNFPQARISREELEELRAKADQLGDDVITAIRSELEGEGDKPV